MSSDEVRVCPLPSRRSLHGEAPHSATSHRVPEPVPPSTGRGRQATKIGVLAGVGVGILTLSAPLAVASSSWHAGTGELKVVGSFGSDDAWAADSTGTIASADELTQVQAAASRAKLRTPVEVSSCVVGNAPANGARTMTQMQLAYWPLQEGTYQVTSPFSWRVSPISGETLMHEGVDMAAPLGTPIHAVADGVVTERGYNSRSGDYVQIKHEAADGTVYYTAYLHQYAEDILVAEGDTVSAGQVIGAVGNAGWSTGPHLHFEVRDSSDTPIDPMTWMTDHGAIFLGEDCQ